MEYLKTYYWFLVIVFFIWIISFTIASFIKESHDSVGDIIQDDNYKNKNFLLTIAFVCMWLFIIGVFLFIFYLYFIIPSDPIERLRIFPFSMLVPLNKKLPDIKN